MLIRPAALPCSHKRRPCGARTTRAHRAHDRSQSPAGIVHLENRLFLAGESAAGGDRRKHGGSPIRSNRPSRLWRADCPLYTQSIGAIGLPKRCFSLTAYNRLFGDGVPISNYCGRLHERPRIRPSSTSLAAASTLRHSMSERASSNRACKFRNRRCRFCVV